MSQAMTYIIQSTKLSFDFIESEIENCLESLYNTNSMVFDYWLSELYDEEDQKIISNWTEENLHEMCKDVEVNQLNVISECVIDKTLYSFV
jgi:hypothetical protein